MVGLYDIEVYNNRVHYFLTIKRNITILQGSSATGKTELIRLIGDYEENGVSSGITLKCEVKCTVQTQVDWESRLTRLTKHIVFIDETAHFVKTREFAEIVRNSDNYYVIITRDDLPQLPYSVDEIYGLRNETSKFRQFKKVYNEMYHLYHHDIDENIVPDVIITEDTNAGFECFDTIFDGKCESAGGKSRIYGILRAHDDNVILVIVDGAAFGCEIGKIYRYLEATRKKCTIYAPESFEYLILNSGVVDVKKPIVDETWLYADSINYMSWEAFYTSYLVEITRDTVYRYSKQKLNTIYQTKGVLDRIVDSLPTQIRPRRG